MSFSGNFTVLMAEFLDGADIFFNVLLFYSDDKNTATCWQHLFV